MDVVFFTQDEQRCVFLPNAVDSTESALGEFRGYLDTDSAGPFYLQYGEIIDYRNDSTTTDFQLCCVRVLQTAFPGKNILFLGYIATIAIPWQAYMVPQFILMRYMGLNNTHLAIILLQAFSAFGVFLMRQFYQGVPDELCEAARIDGLSEYGIWARIMLPLSKPALSTLTIFTFVATWNDFLGPMIYLTDTKLKTIQIGLRMFISQYSAEYGLIMAASVVSIIPVVIVFLALQKYFVQGVAASGIKG